MKNILFIHGTGSGGWAWNKFATPFSKCGFNCVSITLPYHNNDNSESEKLLLLKQTINDYVSFLENEISKLDSMPIVIGHSLGGLLAQLIAARRKSSATILIAPVPPSGVLYLNWDLLAFGIKLIMTGKFWKKPFSMKYEDASKLVFNKLSEQERINVYAKTCPESGLAIFQASFAFLDKIKNAKVDKSQINAPMLIVSGSCDRTVPRKLISKIAKYYSDKAETMEFENRGHWMIEESEYETISNEIISWIDRLGVN